MSILWHWEHHDGLDEEDDESVYEEDGEGTYASNVFDNYSFGKTLGAGDFGEVRQCYSNRNEDAYCDLAVKIVDKDSETVQAASSVISAVDEAHILSSINHHNIVRVLDVFDGTRFLYVIMEKIDGGETFQAIADLQVKISEKDMAGVGKQVLEALDYLHHRLIVHRDIKAENILLSEPPQDGSISGNIVLIDFGLAATLAGDVCGTPNDEGKQLNVVCGTPQYCAPEVWTAGAPSVPDDWKERYGTLYGPKVDVWAVGCVLYIALTGSIPFNGDSNPEIMKSACAPEKQPSYKPLRSTAGYGLSKECVQFLESLLTKAQDDQPSAQEMLDEPWLQRTRGVSNFDYMPAEVRAAAFASAKRIEKRGAKRDRVKLDKDNDRAAAIEADIAEFPQEHCGTCRVCCSW